MTLLSEASLQKLQFYQTAPYSCGYLPNQQAQSLIAAPYHLVTSNIYDDLIQQGFRRSGKFVYQPHCGLCKACIPVRLLLHDFAPNRSQQRAVKQHTNLSASIIPIGFKQEHFALYSQYQKARHADAEMPTSNTADESEQYKQFLCSSHVKSVMIEWRDSQNKLKIVSLVDIVSNGISAVYTFYDTLETKASFGTYSIMWQIKWAKSLGLPYLYLGYWVSASKKMAYKQNFKPQQHLVDDAWLNVF